MPDRADTARAAERRPGDRGRGAGPILQARNQTTEPKGKFRFNPDSKHVVHFGVPDGGNEFRISLDGKFLVAGNGQPYYPTFTPDGRHLFWFDTTFGEPKFTLFLDGNPIFKFDFDNLAVQRPGSWEMGEDGVLTIALRSTGCSSGFGSPRQADVMGWWDQAPGARLDQRCRRTNSRARSAGL